MVKGKKIVFSMFILYLLLGIYSFKDFGISWDEPISRYNGWVSLKYVLEIICPGFLSQNEKFASVTSLRDYVDRDYGVLFDLPMAVVELMFGLTDTRQIFLLRHLFTFLISFLGVVAIYKIGLLRYKDWRLAFLGCLMLVISPRLYAESFYNSKDALFMSMFAVSLYTAIRFISKPNLYSSFFHALSTALSLNIRVMGILVICNSLLLFALLVINKRFSEQYGRLLCFVYLLFSIILTVILWPYLWNSPIRNFLEAFVNMARFRWENHVLYLGVMTKATDLPWHYALVWIGITTPIAYLLLYIVGVFRILNKLIDGLVNMNMSDEEMMDSFFLMNSLFPLASVIVLGSVLYDGWRQLFFIYPSIILISVGGLRGTMEIAQKRLKNKGVIFLTIMLAGNFAWLSFWMVNYHPFQNVYFNMLAGKKVSSRFEVDYWGLANLKALEWIANNDTSELISISASSWTPLKTSVDFLDCSKRDRFNVQESNNTDYVLTNFRYDFPSKMEKNPNYMLINNILVDSEPIVSIYKRKKQT